MMDGRLVAAVGNNMQVMELRGSSLHMISFFHAQLFITSVATIKTFILLGDVHKGLTFVYADKKANYTALTQLSKVPVASRINSSLGVMIKNKMICCRLCSLAVSLTDQIADCFAGLQQCRCRGCRVSCQWEEALSLGLRRGAKPAAVCL